MDEIVGLIGREDVVADLVVEIRKGKHVILTGPVGIGKSAVLKAALFLTFRFFIFKGVGR